MNLLAFGTPGPSEWMLILVIVLVLFGAKRLPELARGLGQSLNEFRKVKDEFDRELRDAANHVKAQPVSRAPAAIPVAPVQAPAGTVAAEPPAQDHPGQVNNGPSRGEDASA